MYTFEVGVKYSTYSTIYVLFDEVVEQVTQLKLANLTQLLKM